MQELSIIVAPDDRLKGRAHAVSEVNADIVQLMDTMLSTMHAANGIGLAAPQVGILKRVIVADISLPDEPEQPICMANPEIVWRSDDQATGSEGCLSLPDQYADVTRPAEIRVRYLDRDNHLSELQVSGLLAKCIQHEIDHLDGVLFVDHISALKRNIILRKLNKARKLAVA